MLKVEELSKSFRTEEIETIALNKVSFEVQQGEFVAVMGPSGCGKSTLLNILGLLDNPTSGQYFLLGKEVGTLKERDRTLYRKGKIGFVFQSFHLLPKLTALDNVALPLLYGGVKKEERRERARAALETVGLSDRVDHRPDQLSGGQCQRVAIARAIVGKPRLLLADEPTGALDSASGAQVMELFQQLHADGSTIIMITHDRGIAHHADTIMTIKDGILSGGENDE